MNKSRLFFFDKLFLAYFSLGLIALQFSYFFFSEYLGIYLGILAFAGAIVSRSLIYFFLSLLTVSVGIAFDYYIRAPGAYYGFYSENGITVKYLCWITTLTYLVFSLFEGLLKKRQTARINSDSKKIKAAKSLYFLFSILIIASCIFISKNTSNLLSSDFDAYALDKYPFLEYISIVIFFYISSSRGIGAKHEIISYLVSVFFVVMCLVTSYRMAAIISMLAIVHTYTQGKSINKSWLIIAWLFSYSLLTIVSYLRVGILIDEITFENILGYKNGRLDNTFTGVIETALIYSWLSDQKSLTGIIYHLIGTILPLPNQLIPDSFLYIIEASEKAYMPGGGLLSGFFVYFNYLLTPFYLAYFYYAQKYRKTSSIASIMNLILFCTITRWWLYGPFVIFKFLGVALFIYNLNILLLQIEKNQSLKKTPPRIQTKQIK